MHQRWIPRSLIVGFILALFVSARRTNSQTSDSGSHAEAYRLKVAVDEIVLNFHVADAHGLPVNDLQLEELSLLDNGKPPRKVVAFQIMQDAPIRAGILMDTSDSQRDQLAGNRAISTRYIQRLLRQQTDEAFVMDFAAMSEVTQPWTNNANALASGVRKAASYGGTHIRGTAIFDAIYRACLNQLGHTDGADSANFILLFSDGEDNASRSSLQDAIRICQATHTAIYSFRAGSATSSVGPKALTDLATESGGRVFRADDTEEGIDRDLRAIEKDLRSQYRLVYRPAELKRDGSFHRIELTAPERENSVVAVRSGYYAPVR